MDLIRNFFRFFPFRSRCEICTRKVEADSNNYIETDYLDEHGDFKRMEMKICNACAMWFQAIQKENLDKQEKT